MTTFTLKTIDQLTATMADLSDNNTGLSFLFYSIVQANTLDYKGESASVIKRLVGSKLFDLVPMARFKKQGQDKAIYQYNRKGSANMALVLDDLGLGSIAELLEVEINQGNDYYPEFAAKVEAYLEAQAEQKKAESKAKKEAEKAEAEAVAAQETADSAAKIQQAETLGMSIEELNDRLMIIEKRQQAMTLLIELGHTAMAEDLKAINDDEVSLLNI